MTDNKLQLEKNRDFGELFNDTFLFIKYNFKNLLKGIIYFVIPFTLLQGIALGVIQYETLSSLSFGDKINVFSSGSVLTATMFSYLFMLLAYSFAMAFVFQYMKLYKSSDSEIVDLKQVWNAMLGVTPKIFLTIISIGIISGIGFVLLVVPGIYLMICFSLVIPIIIFEGDSIGEALNNCFALIKNNWWRTFVFLIVIAMLAACLQFVFQLPMLIYQTIATFHVVQEGAMQSNQSIMILFSIIQTAGASLMQLIPITGIGIMYFSLVEQKQNPALLKELESVGANE
ncbi:glycerophosphoryl diester phosphodiesterase membrane domain-containing protein [Labilibaculum sp.]|uniref:glycerophosphoryl diester phosphodiesterase membrane domain-containing protein n=1 Tax=Labilibaculum sp. TaxID=2060723 RepID=UPI002AA64929|nr:glycerophosphoryl diester phosphodiesterase membrane domain-containing protein [Labilibaculum sp.]MBN2596134.1 glycerophosphoryl diester phosphodiesterase membrane domain-containing protein [Marinifilaceae bacterium]